MTGKQLKTERTRRNLLQGELAKLLGIRVETVSRYETGRYPMPKRVELALAQIFDNLDRREYEHNGH